MSRFARFLPPALFSLIAASFVLAHPGRLDKHGGHVDHKTGYYHCHTTACFEHFGDSVGPIEGEAAPFVTLYDRRDWPHWRDLDGDCQNTRHEVLIRDSLVPVTFADDGQCNVVSGLWVDPYTGKEYRLAAEVSIDHVVPLRWAHGHGGDHWSRRLKEAFANDMDNLLVVESGLNAAKGSKGPDDWLPPNAAFHCEYLAVFTGVMEKYSLRFVAVERQALAAPLAECSQ